MGTTCVAIAARGRVVEIAHVGDSRAYVFRNDSVEQITRDHSYLNDLIDIGLLTPELARNHPERNIITRCVGMADELEVDFTTREARPQDIYLLCSDGLYNHVDDEEMKGVVRSMDPQPACQALVDLANKRGGEDNITVAVMKVNQIPNLFEAGDGEAESQATDMGADDAATPIPGSDVSYSGETPGSTPIIPIDPVGNAMILDGDRAQRRTRGLMVLVAIEIILLVILQVLISRF
jgi:hypothetical protein